MNVNAVMLNKIDKVVTVVEEVKKGDLVNYTKDGVPCIVEAIEDIPAFHKISVTDLKEEEHVIKYGQIIGGMLMDVPKGSWISHKNIKSLPRNYEDEM